MKCGNWKSRANSTTRISTQAISGSLPGIGVHDRLLPNGTEFLGSSNTAVASTESQVVGFELLSGVPEVEAVKAEYTFSLNGDVFKNRLSPVSRRYNVTLPQVFWLYRSFYFAFTEGLIDFAKGFFTGVDSASFSATFYATLLTHDALLQVLSGSFGVDTDNTLIKRALIEALAAAIFSSSTSQVGFRNDTPFPTNGGPIRPAVPFHLQPSLVKYNSVSKSRDLGIVNNFLQ